MPLSIFPEVLFPTELLSADRQIPRTEVLLAPQFRPRRSSFPETIEMRCVTRTGHGRSHTLVLKVDLDDLFAEGIGDIEITRSVRGYAYRNIQSAPDYS